MHTSLHTPCTHPYTHTHLIGTSTHPCTHTPYRYVELFRVNRGEMLQALEQFVGGYLSNNHMPQMMPMGGAMGGNGPPYPHP